MISQLTVVDTTVVRYHNSVVDTTVLRNHNSQL